ncbi:hypothetical protein H5410_007583 [Solanum commersonii]|uniref:Uncharacterized protein n=1 Tax=Solanum commersonii TaxID=4109 RepID=A0A9J6ACH8_SOLCO|nr:hypothetical protein H5410_007583 [Solanum commersonii]
MAIMVVAAMVAVKVCTANPSTIPAKIGNLRKLQQLQVENNHMVGSMPRSISNISSLWMLNLNTNNLSGNLVLFGYPE